MTTAAPRGIRNNNPGNIRLGDNWDGQRLVQTDGSFIQFETPKMGIRAMAKVLLNYNALYDINTIEGIIERWAPPAENKTDVYVFAVSARTGIAPNAPLNLPTDLALIIPAIIHHENGVQPYSQSTINEGIRLGTVG